jgi:beta-carotene ketolase (CrtW type)
MEDLKWVRSRNSFSKNKEPLSLVIGGLIILLWFGTLSILLALDLDQLGVIHIIFAVLGFLLMVHLYTGLFITAHDAMHGLVSKNPVVNKTIGILCAILFSFNSYWKLNPAHHDHHRYVGTEKDPDYHPGNFLLWYFGFVKQYVSIWQILAMAVTYNLLKLVVPTPNLILFWMLPAVLSTLQLFYFGTYLPHRGEHEAADPNKSNPRKRGHIGAFLTCYFFGYHYEHHAFPATPWWLLWRVKDDLERKPV